MDKNELMKNFNGVVSVKISGEVIWQEAAGYRDLANEIPNQVDTKFGTASAGKVFVAVGILKLIEEEKLDLESTIGDLLAIDLKAIDPSITVRQLLTHTSGIPDYFDEEVMEEYAELWEDYPNYKVRCSQDLLPLFIDKPMMYPAGEKFQYNNTGFVVLGLIIESITGKAFDTYLKEAVFDVCGMKDTGYYELDRLPANCANNYIYDEKTESYYTNIYSIDAKGTGAGGVFTTVLDIESFWNHFLRGQIISQKRVEEMLTPQVEEGEYGYGIWLHQTDKGEIIPYFQGCDPGVAFMSSYNRQLERCIVVISNFGDDVWEIHSQLGK